jgi:anti-anti-sigma factor
MQTAILDIETQCGANGEPLLARLRGKLSLETVRDFLNVLRAEPAPRLVLDMSGVTFLDSSGVGALVSLFVGRRTNGRSLVLAGMTPQAEAVLEVSGLMKLLPILPTVEAALTQRA